MKPSRIPRALVRAVHERANGVCEYCRLPQEFQEAAFHVDHIRPRSAGGSTRLENLALASVSCSLRKAARLDAGDPLTKKRIPLFHPRRNVWNEHFSWRNDWRLIGLTPQGRATITALRMNRAEILAIRRLLASVRLFPPTG